MKIPDWAAKRVQSALNGNAAIGFFRMFMGRCTFFATVFAVVGCYGWLVKGRDLSSFAIFAGAIQALLLAHSAKEDYNQRQNQSQGQTQTVDINIQK